MSKPIVALVNFPLSISKLCAHNNDSKTTKFLEEQNIESHRTSRHGDLMEFRHFFVPHVLELEPDGGKTFFDDVCERSSIIYNYWDMYYGTH